MFGSTWYVFDEKSIAGEAEQLLFNFFKPRDLKSPIVAAKIESLISAEGKQTFVKTVRCKHNNTPFKDSVAAKEYAKQFKIFIGLRLQKRYVENFLAEHLDCALPTNSYFSIDREQLKKDIIEKYSRKAEDHALANGELASFLQNLDKNLTDDLNTHFFSLIHAVHNKYNSQGY
jgi:hypothetical protein